MTTVMKKDVALDMIADTLAHIAQTDPAPRQKHMPPDEAALIALLRNPLYTTPYTQLDFAHVIRSCQALQAQYAPLPQHHAYQHPDDIFTHIIYPHLTHQRQPQSAPMAYVLGGQPGAGKSSLLPILAESLGHDMVVINGDDFRRYHPQAAELYAQHGADAAHYTRDFASLITEKAIAQAANDRYHLVIEGTFRTAQTPLHTLNMLKTQGYRIGVALMVVPAHDSWRNVQERYAKQLAAGIAARMTPQAHHDLVVERLADNADEVFQALAGQSRFAVFNRHAQLFHGTPQEGLPGGVIRAELHRQTRDTPA